MKGIKIIWFFQNIINNIISYKYSSESDNLTKKSLLTKEEEDRIKLFRAFFGFSRKRKGRALQKNKDLAYCPLKK